MNCDEVRRFLDAYVDGELDLTHQLDVETHLTGCPDCKEAADQIANFSSLVRMDMEVYKAPRELKSKIRTSLRKESEPKFAWFFEHSRPLAYAAAVLAVRVGGAPADHDLHLSEDVAVDDGRVDDLL